MVRSHRMSVAMHVPVAQILTTERRFLLQNCGNPFKEFATLTVSVDKALVYFATHPEEVLGLFGRYCEESGLALKQAA